jgi:hypothetical protein
VLLTVLGARAGTPARGATVPGTSWRRVGATSDSTPEAGPCEAPRRGPESRCSRHASLMEAAYDLDVPLR